MSEAAVPDPTAEPVPQPTDPASSPAPSTGEEGAPALDPSEAIYTRIIGAIALCLSALFLFASSSRVFELDFGSENQRVILVIRAAAILVPAYPGFLGLIALITGKPPARKFNPLLLPFEAWWYSSLQTLTLREVRRFFFHPPAYVILGVFLCINGLVIAQILESYAGFKGPRDFPIPASYWITENYVMWLSLAFLCPAMTMRLLAEEDRLGTLEMLLTAPITEIQVVLSKFAGAWTFYLLMIGTTAAYQLIFKAYSVEWDWGPVLASYLSLALVGAVILSMGLFLSSLTKSQILAYVFTAMPMIALIIFIPWWAGTTASSDMPDWARAVVRHINIKHHHTEMAKGVVSWSNLTFYVSTTVFFLFLAVRGVESHRWR